jgi:hypothetical protein
VFFVVEGPACHNDPGTVCVRNTARRWERVEPHHNKVHQLHNHPVGDFIEGEGASDCPVSLLDNTYMTFDGRHMFAGRRGVDCVTYDVITEALELSIHYRCFDCKSSFCIDVKTFFRLLTRTALSRLGTYYEVIDLNFLEAVIMKTSPYTNIMSVVSIKFLLRSMISLGI